MAPHIIKTHIAKSEKKKRQFQPSDQFNFLIDIPTRLLLNLLLIAYVVTSDGTLFINYQQCE